MLVLFFILKAVIILAIFSIIIIVHELGHFIAAKRLGVKVERFALGFGKKIFGVKKGETEYAINLIPLGGYVKLAGEDPYERKGAPYEFYSKPISSRLGILLLGPLSNYLFAYLLLVILYTMGIPSVTSHIGMVLESAPAYKAGIKTGDKIISIDEKPVGFWDEVLSIIRSDKDARALNIKVERNNVFLCFLVKPEIITTENIFKQKVTFIGIGIGPSENIVMLKSNPVKSLYLASRHVWFFTVTTYKGIWFLVTGAMPIKDNIGGPIRIIDALGKAINAGPVETIHFLAIINLALAIFNLLPFPILDGGHILFLGIEKLRGKPLSVKTQEIITQTALVLLIAFFLYVSYYDVRVVTNLKK